MRIFHRLKEVRPASPSHVTIGVFDGVHRGHQRLIRGMVEAGHSVGNLAVAVTFAPHPDSVLDEETLPLLTTLDERTDLLSELGLDILTVLPFTAELASTPAADFVDELRSHLRLAELWVGPDFTLGHQREGDASFLRRLGAQLGFVVRVVESTMWRGEVVHSSRVRKALRRGDVTEANGCLGRPYRLTGTVACGRGLGQGIGVPTANIRPSPDKLIPARGVYACLAHTERWGTHPAATNIGTRPTLRDGSDAGTLAVEAHLLDFDDDLYDRALALDFIARLRDERSYPTVDALVTQLRDDIAQTRAILRQSS